MTGRWVEMREDELGAALRDLGSALEQDRAGVDLARAARLRIEGASAMRSARRWWAFPVVRLGRGTALAIVALLLLAAVVAALGFGLPGIRIVVPPPTPSPVAPATAAPAPSPAAIDGIPLGVAIDPDGIDAAAGFHVQLPSLPELGAPTGAYVLREPGPIVNVTFGSSPAFPAPTRQSIGLIVTALQAQIGDQPALLKEAEPGTTVDAVSVDGHAGFWIAGAPHRLVYGLPDGNHLSDAVRLVGNVLAWNDGEVTYRIEGAADLPTALRIAASMR